MGRSYEITGTDQRHVDVLLDQQLSQQPDIVEIDHLWRIEGGTDEFGRTQILAAAGGDQHRAKSAIERCNAERMQPRRIMLCEIFDVEAALEILVAAHPR